MTYMSREHRGILFIVLSFVIVLASLADTAEAVCTPLGTTTSNHGLCKPDNGEPGWTNALNSNWDKVDNHIVPSGAVMFYAAATPPGGWYACDGSAKNRTTDAALFAVIGTIFGAGDGSTTFNLPDGRSRNIIMAGTGPGLSARNLGATGGEENHVLSTTEMPSHTHPVQGFGSCVTQGCPGTTFSGAYQSSGTYNADFNTNASGGGGSHNVMDPFLALTCMIKK